MQGEDEDQVMAPSPTKDSNEPVVVRALFQRQPFPVSSIKESAYYNEWAKIEGVKQILSMFARERDDKGKLPLYYVMKVLDTPLPLLFFLFLSFHFHTNLGLLTIAIPSSVGETGCHRPRCGSSPHQGVP